MSHSFAYFMILQCLFIFFFTCDLWVLHNHPSLRRDGHISADAQRPTPTSQPSQPAQAMLPSGLGAPLHVLRNRCRGVYLSPGTPFTCKMLWFSLSALENKHSPRPSLMQG